MSASAKFRSNEVSLAERALAACREYNRISRMIAENTQIMQKSRRECWPPDEAGTCLEIAWREQSSEEIDRAISHCPACHAAYQAFVERKENRRLLRAIKRRIRRIGQ